VKMYKYKFFYIKNIKLICINKIIFIYYDNLLILILLLFLHFDSNIIIYKKYLKNIYIKQIMYVFYNFTYIYIYLCSINDKFKKTNILENRKMI